MVTKVQILLRGLICTLLGLGTYSGLLYYVYTIQMYCGD